MGIFDRSDEYIWSIITLIVILKGKKWKDDWYLKDMQPGDQISLSENGWTDNKLCIEWL